MLIYLTIIQIDSETKFTLVMVLMYTVLVIKLWIVFCVRTL